MFGKMKDKMKGFSESVDVKKVKDLASARVSDGVKKVSAASESVNIKSSIDKVNKFASDNVDAQKEKFNAAIETHWPKVEHVLLEGLVNIAQEKLNDEAFLNSMFEKAYEVLPVPVRLLLPREMFLTYCVKHRGPILLKIDGYKERKLVGLSDEVPGENT